MDGIAAANLKIRPQKFDMWVFCILFAAYCGFCLYLMSEVPYLTWFDFTPIAEKFAAGTLGFSDLLWAYGEHGMLGYSLLFLLNVAVFNMSVFFDVWLNNICVLFVALCCYWFIRRTVDEGPLYRPAILLLALVSFNFMQLTSGAMETQVRLGAALFIPVAWMSGEAILFQKSPRYLAAVVGLTFLNINVFGTMYSFAGIGACMLAAAVVMVCRKKVQRGPLVVLVCNIAFTALYLVEYGTFGRGGMKGSVLGPALGTVFTSPFETAKAFIAYLGSTVLGAAGYKVLPGWLYLLVGLAVAAIYGFAIYCFFSGKMYTRTLVPLLFMVYTVATFGMVFLSRIHLVEGSLWTLFPNWWYHMHTKPGAIACVWILLYYSTIKSEHLPVLVKKYVGRCLTFLLVALMLAGNAMALYRVPHERQYYLSKQPYLFYTEEFMPVDEDGITPLTESKDMTMNAIEVMKNLHLSVYRYHDIYENSLEHLAFDTSGGEEGLWDDGWAEPYVRTSVTAGATGRVSLLLYYPGEITDDLKGTVQINGVAHNFKITDDNILLEYEVEPNSEVDIVITSEFVYSGLSEDDERQLSFVLLELTAE